MSGGTVTKRSAGWMLFAATMLVLAGAVNVVWGIAAIGDSAFFTDQGRYVLFDDLSAWGWFFLVIGILQLLSVLSLSRGGQFGVIFGSFCASINAVVLLFTVNAFPIAAFMLFIVDLLVIWALTTFGSRQEA